MHHVLNWLWQGIVIAAAAYAALRALDRSRAHARYLLCWGAILAIVALPLLTVSAPLASAGDMRIPAAFVPAALSLPDAWWSSPSFLLLLWAMWSGVCCVRIAGELRAVRRARTRCARWPAGRESRLRCWRLVQAHGRRTRLVLSRDVGPAAVLGGGSPVIALAPRLLDEMTDNELDRVVVHEWAHVQRRDDVLNLMHVAVQTIAGWHPGVWWLQRQATMERESACDEMAVAVTGSARGYAASLVAVAGIMSRKGRPLATAGVLSSSVLSARVSRILATAELASSRRSAAAAFAVVLALAICSASLVRFPLISLAGPAPTLAAVERRSPPGVDSDAAAATPVTRAPLPADRRTAVQLRPAPQRSRPPETAARQARPVQQEAVAIPLLPLRELPGRPAVFRQPPPQLLAVRTAVPASPAGESGAGTPWGATAEAGIAVARGSRKAAAATSGFFTRVGNRIGSSF